MGSDDSIETKLAVLANDMNYVRKTLDQVDNKVSTHYVTREEFEAKLQKYDLTTKIVFGLVGLIVVAVIGAIMNLVVAKP